MVLMSSFAANPELTEKLRGMPKEAIIASLIALIFSVLYVDYFSFWGLDAQFMPLILLDTLLDGDLFDEFASVLFAVSRIIVPILLIAACLYRGKGQRWLAIGAFAVECIGSFLAIVVGYTIVPISGIIGLVLSVAALVVVVLAPVARKKFPAFPFIALGALALLSVVLIFTDLSPYGYVDIFDNDAELLISSFIRNPAIWIAGAFLCMRNEPSDVQVRTVAGSSVKTAVVASAVSVGDVAAQVKAYKELFDIGAITEEEFSAKKKELLGL